MDDYVMICFVIISLCNAKNRSSEMGCFDFYSNDLQELEVRR
jgi:hypothetical protein